MSASHSGRYVLRVILRHCHYLDHSTSDGRITWIIKDLEGTGRCLIKIRSRYLPGGTGENHGNLSQDSGASAKIPLGQSPNTSLDCYHYTNRLGTSVLAPEKKSLVPTALEVGRATDPVRTLFRRQHLCPCLESNHNSLVVRPVP
jgi:hypothetical protein